MKLSTLKNNQNISKKLTKTEKIVKWFIKNSLRWSKKINIKKTLIDTISLSSVVQTKLQKKMLVYNLFRNK